MLFYNIEEENWYLETIWLIKIDNWEILHLNRINTQKSKHNLFINLLKLYFILTNRELENRDKY